MKEELTPVPAATLVLMRPGKDAPELLAMERAAKMVFAPGAIVFPGGRVEPDDHALAERIGGGLDHAAARITAIRETIEEVGVAAGFVDAPDPALLAKLRTRLHDGEPFSGLLDRFDLALDLEALTPFARWCPKFNPVRRFDTLFLVAESHERNDPPAAHEHEAVHSFWASARHILDEAAAGRLTVIFPTKRNLERVAQFANIDEARADAAAHPLQTIVPWIDERDGEQCLCIPDGLGYPVTHEPITSVRRGWEPAD